ncbi:aflatoxin regulatory protein-domain-containing protein, partial [Xylogone sp. PMI_703]
MGLPTVIAENHKPVAQTTPKIRDSCQACASSKVRCTKEKPTCSRCARRGFACKYLVTKRPGRKRNSSDNARGDLSEVQKLWPNHSDPSPNYQRPGSAAGIDSHSISDTYSDVLTPSLASTLPEISSEFDKFGDAFTESFDLGTPETINFTEECNDIERLLMLDTIDYGIDSAMLSLDYQSMSQASFSFPNVEPLLAGHASVTSIMDSICNSTCNCLTVALELLRLSSSTPTVCSLTNSPGNGTAKPNTSHNSTCSAPGVITENKETIEAISNVLQCTCAEDAYILIIMSMIVFKILGKYAAAVAQKPTGELTEKHDLPSKNPSLLSHCYPYEQENQRKNAQLILSELHYVQRFVKQLSPKLKARGIGGSMFGAKDVAGCNMTSDTETTTVAVSATTLDQIEIDLRRCLNSLSSGIISMLRKS